MAAPSNIRAPAGLRRIQVLAINSDGYPAATSTTVYEGVQVQNAKTLGLDDPAPREIIHTGDDRVYATQTLPPDRPITGTMSIDSINDALDALLTGKVARTIGEANLMGIGTDKKGEEIDVVLLAFRQARIADLGSSDLGEKVWDSVCLCRTRVVPSQPGMGADTEPVEYSIVPGLTSKYPWGTSFSESADGYTRAQGFRMSTDYKPWIVAWKADGTTVAYTFHANRQAYSTGKIHRVWVNGSLQTVTSDYTAATTGVTFVVAPATDAIIVCLYEWD